MCTDFNIYCNFMLLDYVRIGRDILFFYCQSKAKPRVLMSIYTVISCYWITLELGGIFFFLLPKQSQAMCTDVNIYCNFMLLDYVSIGRDILFFYCQSKAKPRVLMSIYTVIDVI